MYIEIVTTPNEALKESGFGMLKSCESILYSTQLMGYNVKLSLCKTIKDVENVVKRKPELVILAVKYIPIEDGENIWLSDFFSQRGINFTGSTREVLRFDSNKVLAKTHLTNKGIKTARYFLATPGQFASENDLPIKFPLFLKPLDAANGNGIDDASYVTNFTDYQTKLDSLCQSFDKPILVEEYLDGREFTVAIIRTASDNLVISAIEIVPPTSKNGLKILGSQTKREDSEELKKISNVELEKRVTELAIDAFNKLGVRDFGRIDIKSNKKGECFFMEANLVPGMSYGSSYFPEAFNIKHGFSYDTVIVLLLAGGLSRISSTFPPNLLSGRETKLVKTK